MFSLGTNDSIRKWLFPLTIISLLFFFSKMARHPEKSDGLLMILILTGAIFLTFMISLITLFYPNHDFLENVKDTLGKFLDLWILFLAGCHYFALKRFKKKFKEISFRSSIIYVAISSLAIASISNVK